MFIKVLTCYLLVILMLFAWVAGGVRAEGLADQVASEQLLSGETLSESVGESPVESPDNLYRLGADDVLKIIVYGEPDLTNSFTVSGNGTISFPLIGEINVEGLTLRDVEDLIEARLSDGYLINPSVSIEVTTYRPFYILGEVRAPGSYNYVSGISVLKAVALAGGFTYRADKKHVQILKTRKDGSSFYDKMPVSASIAPGDIVLVKERFF